MLWTIYVMTSSIAIGPVPIMDSGIMNEWMNEWMNKWKCTHIMTIPVTYG